jgi:hypothetical protein
MAQNTNPKLEYFTPRKGTTIYSNAVSFTGKIPLVAMPRRDQQDFFIPMEDEDSSHGTRENFYTMR